MGSEKSHKESQAQIESAVLDLLLTRTPVDPGIVERAGQIILGLRGLLDRSELMPRDSAELAIKIYDVLTEFSSQLNSDISFNNVDDGESSAIVISTLKFIYLFDSDSVAKIHERTKALVEVNSDADVSDEYKGIRLEEYVSEVVSWMQELYPPILDSLLDIRRNYRQYSVRMDEPVLNLIVERQIARLSTLENVARRSIDNIRTSSIGIGTERQAQSFASRGKAETQRAFWWTIAVFVFIALGILLPVIALSVETEVFSSVSGLTGTVVKALIALPLFGAAAYCGRIAAQHREFGRHMNLLTVQMDTVGSFTEQLSEEERSEILMLLGRRIFSAVVLETKDDGKVSVVPQELVPILDKAMDIAKDATAKRS
ncbi:hypothetical protein [Williamsia sp. DF01-3]|uniref:hypothetical protein n=1 Tax=Williamsia sp. DF01-3 TaxID=2934157 RepID=UPI001FF17B49|nr:hypothetical protein [Williamsia sp. DF01-3]MCK0519308.1 hypothetical protein [Williamsia sp. DF01-3]